MGRHATQVKGRRRGVAGWLIASLVALVVVAAVVVVFIVNGRSRSTAADCTSSAQLPVVASPEVASAVSAAAAAFDRTQPIARSACITTQVTPLAGAQTAALLLKGWSGTPAPAPALWIPDSVLDIDVVGRADGALIAGRSTTPLAASPVVLAVRSSDIPAIRSVNAAAFTWLTLAGLGAATDPPSGPWSVTLPDPARNLAARNALQSVVAADRATRGPAGTAISAQDVTTAAPRLAFFRQAAVSAPPTTADALTALQSGTAGFTAVPALESEVAAAVADGRTAIGAVYPNGPTVMAEVYAVPISGPWVDETRRSAAADFAAFLDSPPGEQALVDHGLRIKGIAPAAPVGGISAQAPASPVPDAPAAVQEALLTALNADTSSSTPASTTPPATTTPASTTPASTTPVTTVGSTTSTGSGPGTATVASTPTRSTAATSTSPPVSATGTSSSGPGTVSRSGTTSGTATTPSSTTSPTGTSPAGTGPAVTFLVDASSSMNTDVNGKSRFALASAAVTDFAARNPGAQVGLWVVSSDVDPAGYTQVLPTGPVSQGSAGSSGPDRISTALSAVPTSGSCWSYGALQTAYAQAAQNPVSGRRNYVVLITASSDSTPSLPRAKLVGSIDEAAGSGVVLDVVGLSDEVNSSAFSEIAQAGKGAYTALGADALDQWLLDPSRFAAS